MAKRKTSGGSAGANAIKVILLIFVVVVILAAAVFGIYYLSNGFGGRYATFAASVNGDIILKSGSIDLPRGSTVKVASFSDYSFEVRAAQPEQDFELNVDGERLNFSDLAGEDMTAGFTFTEEDGAITVDYGSLDDILTAALGKEVVVATSGEDALFTLVITSGSSSIGLDFHLSSFDSEYTIIIDPDHVIFWSEQ